MARRDDDVGPDSEGMIALRKQHFVKRDVTQKWSSISYYISPGHTASFGVGMPMDFALGIDTAR